MLFKFITAYLRTLIKSIPSFMFRLKRRQRSKIIHSIYLKNYTNILSLISLPFLAIMK